MNKSLEIDKVKVQIFVSQKNTAFYGALMSALDVSYEPEADYIAALNLKTMKIGFGPTFFEQPISVQEAIYVHELNHIARLHKLRMGNRNPYKWNVACDYEINNHLVNDGYSFGDLEALVDRKYEGLAAEEIYDLLPDVNDDGAGGVTENFDKHDFSGDDSTTLTQLAAVERAVQAAKMRKEAVNFGAGSSYVEKIFTQFKNPKLPWKTILRNYITEYTKTDYSFARPNRRHEMYLPSLVGDTPSFGDIALFFDCSGSVYDAQRQACLSEGRAIKQQLNPREMHLVYFDTEILHTDIIPAGKQLGSVKDISGGGTDLRPVHDYIVKHKPKLVIIMSDLYVPPMEPIKGVDIIWLVLDNPGATVNQGKVIHLEV